MRVLPCQCSVLRGPAQLGTTAQRQLGSADVAACLAHPGAQGLLSAVFPSGPPHVEVVLDTIGFPDLQVGPTEGPQPPPEVVRCSLSRCFLNLQRVRHPPSTALPPPPIALQWDRRMRLRGRGPTCRSSM